MSFTIETVTQIAPAILKVAFSAIPRMADDGRSLDSLTIANYSISGPGYVTISVSTEDESDPKSVLLYTTGNMDDGDNWTLTVNDTIEDTLANTLTGQLAWEFEGAEFPINTVTGGAENETASQMLRRYINPKLTGKNWNALISALATGEQKNWDDAQLAFEQMYRSSASGKYLLQRGSDYGIQQPKNVGLSDELFRKYLNQITNRQLTLNSLNEILEVFYGVDGTHAISISANSEPYTLGDGWDLELEVNAEEPINLIFSEDDFDDITNVSALELSVIINENLDLLGAGVFVTPFLDPEDNETKLKFISENVGLNSAITILGGRAQNALKFDTWIDSYIGAGSLPDWEVEILTTNKVKFTTDTDPCLLDLSLIHEGDYVNIYGSEFSSENLGSFTVTKVEVAYTPGLVQSFEIENQYAVEESVTQIDDESIVFFRPTKKTIYSISPLISAFVAQIEEGSIEVILPATPNAVEREEFIAAYLQDYDSYTINSMEQTFSLSNGGDVSVTLDSPHGLTISNEYGYLIDGLKPSLTPPSTIAGSSGVVDSSSLSIWSNLDDNPNNYGDARSSTLKTGVVVITGGRDPSQLAAVQHADVFSTFTFDGSSAYSWDSGNLNGRRAYHASSTIFDETLVFITGGATDPTTLGIDTCELIFPNTMTAITRSNMSDGRMYHAQVTLADGRVLVCGGQNVIETNIGSVEIYDPVADSWTTVTSMNLARSNHFACLLDDGMVMVCGGAADISGDSFQSITTEIYDPDMDTWTFAGNRTYISGNGSNQIIKLKDGRVLAAGAYGYIAGHSPVNSLKFTCEIFDPDTRFWTKGPDLISELLVGDFSTLDIMLMSFYLEDKQIERVLAVQRFYEAPIENVKSQFIDFPRIGQVKYMPQNMVDLRWRRGPNFDLDISGWLLLSKSKDNSILFSNAINDDGGEAAIPDAKLYIMGADEWGAIGVNKRYITAEITDVDQFTSQADEFRIPAEFELSDANVQFLVAPDDDGIAGPYIWDPSTDGIVIAGDSFTIDQDLFVGQSYSQIVVSSTEGLPDSGYLAFNYGYDDNLLSEKNLVSPVKYTGILSDTLIKLDASFVFPYTVNNGSSVSLVSQLEPYDPDNANELGSFYTTDTPAGRIAAQNAVDKIAAGGLEIDFIVKYPLDTGLGGAGQPISGDGKLSDVIYIWGDIDSDGDA